MQELERNIPLGERVYEQVKGMIVSGELGPNHPVPESVLAKQLGVSRSPVKAALTRLQEDGLVVGEAWKVPTVAPLDQRYVNNTYQVRKALDAQSAIQAIMLIPASKVDEFARLLDDAHDHLDDNGADKVREAFFYFQSLLRDYCDNDLLRSMLRKLDDHLARIRNAVHRNDDQEWLRMEYWMLRDELETLRARDATRLVSTLNNQHEQFVRWLTHNWTL